MTHVSVACGPCFPLILHEALAVNQRTVFATIRNKHTREACASTELSLYGISLLVNMLINKN
jgi:hypothetical protein